MCDSTLEHTLMTQILWGPRTAPMGKGDTKPQLLKGHSSTPVHFQGGAQGGKEVVWEFIVIFSFGFYFHSLEQQGVPKHTEVLVQATLSLLQALADSQLN